MKTKQKAPTNSVTELIDKHMERAKELQRQADELMAKARAEWAQVNAYLSLKAKTR